MRILLTGGAGFIGSNLVHLLVAKGHQVLNIDKLTYAGNPHSLSDLEGNPNLQLLLAVICDAEAMRKAFTDFRPDWVMHLAAESHVDRSIDGPGEFIQTMIDGAHVSHFIRTCEHLEKQPASCSPRHEVKSMRRIKSVG
jgi:dTDP-glucose 4,6-dehydratase